MRLVFRIDVVAKSFAFGIEHTGQVFGAIILSQAAQHVKHTVNRAGRFVMMIAQIGHGMKSAVEIGRAVHQQECFGAALIRGFLRHFQL
jgi:hypothetical protein